MIRLRELLQQVLDERKGEKGGTPTSNSAEAMGLEKKPGFGAWGPAGQNLVTHRTLRKKNRSSVLPVVPHRIGQKPVVPPGVARFKRQLRKINKKS